MHKKKYIFLKMLKVQSNSIFLILTSVLPMVLSQAENAKSSATIKGLGKAICFLNGDYDQSCKLETVLCNQLPKHCSSYVWNGAQVDLNFDVYDIYGPQNDAYLQKLLKCAKVPVYVAYGYDMLSTWTVALACCASNGKNVKNEVEGLKAYLDSRKTISGILLANLDTVIGQPNFEDFSSNFKSYVSSLRSLKPDLEVGILLYADQFQIQIQNPEVEYIDFNEVKDILDYFVIGNGFYNGCSKEFAHSIIPISGNADFTLEKIQSCVEKAGIPKEKLYYRFELYPTDENSVSTFCKTSIQQVCADHKIALKWCSETIASLYEKGVFAQKHASGFGGAFVDMDDVHCVCQCNRSFPAFYAVLDGFDGAPMPAPCPLFDRCLD